MKITDMHIGMYKKEVRMLYLDCQVPQQIKGVILYLNIEHCVILDSTVK